MIDASVSPDGMNVIRVPKIVMRNSVNLLWDLGRQVYRYELIKHLIKGGNCVILPSFVQVLYIDCLRTRIL